MLRGVPVVRVAWLGALVACVLVSGEANAGGQIFTRRPAVSTSSIRGHMEMLASDALHGRASGSRDEWIAATYVAAQLRRFGVEPLGDDGGYLHAVDVPARPAPSSNANTETLRVAESGTTWNVYGRIAGSSGSRQAILLSAHLDHLGVRGTSPDSIFNGADDDASGVTAVLELARVFAGGARLRRDVVVAFFGSEESGGAGARAFLAGPPVPLDTLVANLEFEMIGRPDPSIAPGVAWLTGFERSTLGPALAAHGAHVVADPHPEQHFFERSDNIQLARRGVVAQTVSTFGLHAQYHTPADDLSHIDFGHMTTTIASLVRPIAWLANSDFVPTWRPGLKPEPRQPSSR